MLRLLAALALLAPAAFGVGLAADDHPGAAPASHEPPIVPYEQDIDVSALPLPNGWIVVPVLFSAPAAYEVEIETMEATSEDGTGYADAVLFGNAEDGYVSGAGAGSAGQFEASTNGHAVECCTVHGAPPMLVGNSWGGGGGLFFGEAQAGQHWFALAVADAHTYDVEVVLRTSADVATLGEPQVGTTAERFDLAADARDSTTHVELGVVSYLTPGGAASRAWSADGGFLALFGWASGASRADLRVDLPGVGEQEALLEESYAFAEVLGTGDFRLALPDLREPTRTPLAPEQAFHRVQAVGLWADLPLDGEFAYYRAEPWE